MKAEKRRPQVRKSSALEFFSTIESTWKGHELFAMWLVAKVKPKIVVDLGFDRALSTIAFAYKNRGHVYGIDWFEGNNYLEKCFALDGAYRNISNALRFHYAKNIHLIVGPYQNVLKNWKRKIDILHLDGVHTYEKAQFHYQNWSPHLSEKGIILIHDVAAYPSETGRFFEELPLHKMVFDHARGLGVASTDAALIEAIKEYKPQR
jgi:predicted O-methyltransferase YrrM